MIVFMFLTIEEVFHPEIWKSYWKGSTLGEDYGVVAHAKCPHRLHPPSSLLFPFLIPEHVKTQWGHISLVKATLALWKHACETYPTATHFLLVSESCCPVGTFETMRSFLKTHIHHSLFSLCNMQAEEREQRYRRFRAREDFPEASFLKASQWCVLHRSDWEAVFSTMPFVDEFSRVFAADEHYFVNVLQRYGRPFLHRRWTYSHFLPHQAHPVGYRHASASFLEYLASIGFFFFRKLDRRFHLLDL